MFIMRTFDEALALLTEPTDACDTFARHRSMLTAQMTNEDCVDFIVTRIISRFDVTSMQDGIFFEMCQLCLNMFFSGTVVGIEMEKWDGISPITPTTKTRPPRRTRKPKP